MSEHIDLQIIKDSLRPGHKLTEAEIIDAAMVAMQTDSRLPDHWPWKKHVIEKFMYNGMAVRVHTYDGNFMSAAIQRETAMWDPLDERGVTLLKLRPEEITE